MSTQVIASKVFIACNLIGTNKVVAGRTLNSGSDLKRYTAALLEAASKLTKKQQLELISRLRA